MVLWGGLQAAGALDSWIFCKRLAAMFLTSALDCRSLFNVELQLVFVRTSGGGRFDCVFLARGLFAF